ncbi:MAG: glycoside-pentoside-hexuronide (GPH):cation symporter [Dethiobacteria bacterium]
MNFLHKLFGTSPGKGIQPKEVLAYSVAGFGQNLICALITSFLLFFYTDGVGLLPAGVAYLMLGVRLFDAFNDPIMGSIVDRTRTKWGKLRPYLLFTPIPIGILTMLCFTTIPGDYNTKFIYATITYVIWSVLYTIVDVPYWGLSTALTSDTNKRATLLTVARLACTAGAGLVSISVPAIVNHVQNKTTGGVGLEAIAPALQEAMKAAIAADLRQSFVWVAAIVAILAVPLFFIGFKYTNERYYSPTPPLPLGQNLKLLTKNTPLMLIVLSGVLGMIRMVYFTSGLYFAKYCLDNAAVFTIITLATAPGGLLASVFTPYLSKKFGKRDLYIYSHIGGAIVMFAMYFVGWRTPFGLWFNFIGLILLGIPSGFSNILTYAMIADTVDYLEWKTGQRAEGICFSMQTFISKIGMAACAFATMLTLSIVGFVENTAATTYVQDGIYFTSIFLAGISMLATTIPLFFYKFTEKEQARVVAITAARKGLDLEEIGLDNDVKPQTS